MLPKWSQISALRIHLPHYSQSDDHLKTHPNSHLFKDWSGFLLPVEQPGIHSSTAQLPSVCAASSTLPCPALPSPPVMNPLLQPFQALRVCPHLNTFPSCGSFCTEAFLPGISKGSLRSGGRIQPTFLLRAPKWKSVPDLTVGVKWKYTLVPHETADKFFSGSKSKAAKEGWGGKEIKPSPPSQVSLQPCLMLSGGSCMTCPYKEGALWAENCVGRSQRKQGSQTSDYISV